jgi:hypothetical protein
MVLRRPSELAGIIGNWPQPRCPERFQDAVWTLEKDEEATDPDPRDIQPIGLETLHEANIYQACLYLGSLLVARPKSITNRFIIWLDTQVFRVVESASVVLPVGPTLAVSLIAEDTDEPLTLLARHSVFL